MRILIYSETEAAKAQQAQEREYGNHASLRNPHYFDPAQFEKACDLVIADDPVILAAYVAAGIHTQRLTPEPIEDNGEPDAGNDPNAPERPTPNPGVQDNGDPEPSPAELGDGPKTAEAPKRGRKKSET